MSKKIRLRALAAMLAAAAILTVLQGINPHAHAQQAQQSGAAISASSAARNAAVVAATADVLQETSKIRQLSVLRPVKSGAQSRAEIERMIVKNLDEDTTPEELRASGVALKNSASRRLISSCDLSLSNF
jgi:mevalonate pyrophosphate decarboxylase